MLVKNWMSKDLVVADIDDSMDEAVKLLKKHNIRMLPVMKKGKLAGVVTDRDLKRAQASDATTLDIHEMLYLLSNIKIRNVMAKQLITIPNDYTVEETADILLSHKISGAPVVDPQGKLVGVITKNDLFRALIALSGFGQKGIQFAFRVEDRAGSIKEIADIIRDFGGRMVSILSTYENVAEGFRKVYIRIYEIERQDLPKMKEEFRKKAALLYMVDHRDNIREIYE